VSLQKRPKSVVIVGAGIAGLSTAIHLAEKGVERVTIVDKGKVGDGSSIRAAGIVTMLQHNPASIRARARSLDIFERFSKILDGYTFHQVGCLNLMTHQAFEDNAPMRDIQNNLGAKIELLRGSELHEKFPDMVAGEDDFGVLDLRGGYSEPHHYVPALAAKIRSLGVEIREHEPLTEFAISGDRVTGVATANGETIEAEAVVCTVNAWANHVLGLTGQKIPMKNFVHERFVTTPFSRPPRLPAVNENVKDGYIRPTHDNRLLVGSVAHNPSEFTMPGPDFSLADVEPDPTALPFLREAMVERVPMLADAEWDYHRAGLISFAMDANPVIGPVPGLHGAYVGVNFHSGGFGYNPVAGMLLSEYVVDGKTSIDVDDFLPSRFADVDVDDFLSTPLRHHDMGKKRH